jgi:sirohydrochlorin cobaltochelatase
MPSAYLLVSHGSRDPRQEIAMQQLAKLVKNKLESNLQKSLIAGVMSPPKEHLKAFILTAPNSSRKEA